MCGNLGKVLGRERKLCVGVTCRRSRVTQRDVSVRRQEQVRVKIYLLYMYAGVQTLNQR